MPRFRLGLLLVGFTLGSVAGTFVALGSPAAADAGADASQFVALTNQARAAQGLAPLSSDGTLAGIAASWSSHMAGAGTISHNPSLASQVSGWRMIGENVGMGPSVASIQQAFLNSPAHYHNIVTAAFSRVGVAVSYSGGTIFVTLDFMQPMGAAATAAPRPAQLLPRTARSRAGGRARSRAGGGRGRGPRGRARPSPLRPRRAAPA